MNTAITVMITDDHSMIREGLKNLEIMENPPRNTHILIFPRVNFLSQDELFLKWGTFFHKVNFPRSL